MIEVTRSRPVTHTWSTVCRIKGSANQWCMCVWHGLWWRSLCWRIGHTYGEMIFNSLDMHRPHPVMFTQFWVRTTRWRRLCGCEEWGRQIREDCLSYAETNHTTAFTYVTNSLNQNYNSQRHRRQRLEWSKVEGRRWKVNDQDHTIDSGLGIQTYLYGELLGEVPACRVMLVIHQELRGLSIFSRSFHETTSRSNQIQDSTVDQNRMVVCILLLMFVYVVLLSDTPTNTSTNTSVPTPHSVTLILSVFCVINHSN